MTDAEVCCGFGGTFCVKYPGISDKMLEKKLRHIEATGADTLIAGDLGCLMNMAGKLKRMGSAIKVRHVAEVLAGRLCRQPPIAEAEVMDLGAANFKDNVGKALADDKLQFAMTETGPRFIAKRTKAREALPEFDQLRDEARDIKDHVLDHLDIYLETYEAKVKETGGHVHWAETPDDARAAVLEICRKANAKMVTKGKSMISEEIDLNQHLEANGITPVETDLGEYIIQLRNERPSHIIAPAVHLTRDQVEADFRRVHTHLDPKRDLTEIPALVEEARAVLRQKYLAADVGITGANFLIAETGTSIIVTNEGNGDLTQTLPKVHIVLASIEKLVPTLEDATTILRVLARSATGQDFSNYTTFSTGGRRPGDPDGPVEYHVVLLDNGRSERARHRVPGHAALHPLRRLPQPLPGLQRGGRPRLWLGLSRPHRLGGDAGADRHRERQAPSQRVDLLRPLRGSLPDAHSDPQDAAALAREGVRAPPAAHRGALGPRPVGVDGEAPEALPPGDGACRARAGQPGARQGPAQQGAARLGLDGVPRYSRTAGQDLPPAVEGAPPVSAREIIIGRVRAKLPKAPGEAAPRGGGAAHLAQHRAT